MRNVVRCLQNIIVSAFIMHGVLGAQELQDVQTPSSQPEATQPQSAPDATPSPAQPVSPPVAESQTPPTPQQPATQITEQVVEINQTEQPQVPAQLQSYGPDEIQGIDTVDIAEEEAQGNWLYKRVWWERAEKKFENIRKAINEIFEKRTGFFAQRAELDKNVLDPFYIKIGLSQGGLQEALTELIAKMSGAKDEKEGELLEQAEGQKSELEQLQKEVEQVVKQDNEVDEAISMLVEQLSKMRRLEQEAWQNFKNIARVLDDRKARELFYKVDNAWRNIQEMQAYIDKTFTSSFATLVDRIKEKIQKIDTSILALKEKGIDLKKQLSTEEQLQEQEEEAPKGFFTRYFVDPVKSFFNKVWQVVRWPYDKLMGKKAAPQEDEEEVLEEVIEAEEKAEGPSTSTPPEKSTPIEEAVEVEEEVSESPLKEDQTDTQTYQD